MCEKLRAASHTTGKDRKVKTSLRKGKKKNFASARTQPLSYRACGGEKGRGDILSEVARDGRPPPHFVRPQAKDGGSNRKERKKGKFAEKKNNIPTRKPAALEEGGEGYRQRGRETRVELVL